MSPSDSPQKHLLDLERVIAELEAFSKGRTLDQLLTDRTLQLVFEREFEILGEAMGRLLRSDASVEAQITHARRVIGLRNILSHGYDSVDHRILWAAAIDHLPRLKVEIDRLLRKSGPTG